MPEFGGAFYSGESSMSLVYPLPLVVEPIEPFIVYREVLTPRTCRRVVKQYEGDLEEGATGDYGQTTIVDQAGLYPDVEPMVYEAVADVLLDANQHYRYSLSGFYEPLRLVAYRTGRYSGMHADFAREDRSKLSISIQLNDDYEGDGLRILNEPLPNLSPGDAVVFPSWWAHEVRPTRRGCRYAIVGWAAGPAFV